MSRGYGHTQRQVLDQLHQHAQKPTKHDRDTWIPVIFLADWITPEDQLATRSDIESIRRAVKKLAAAGVIETKKVSYGYYPTKRVLAARLPVSPEDTARHREQARADAAAIDELFRQAYARRTITTHS